MATPLEYLLMMMMSTPGNVADHANGASKIEPASGDALAKESVTIEKDGDLQMRTILMEPRDVMAEKLEAPVRIMPEWVPWFKIGSKLNLSIDETGKSYTAKIARIESITDESGQSVQVILEIPKNKDALQAGMTGTAMLDSKP